MTNQERDRDSGMQDDQGRDAQSGGQGSTGAGAGGSMGGQGSTGAGAGGSMGGQGWQDPKQQDQNRGSGSDDSTETAMQGEREETSRS